MAQLPTAAAAAAAAANVAAVIEESAAWEDALDLDDSDIRFVPPPVPHSFDATASQHQQDNKPAHPSHDPSHHHHHRIPAPAAAALQDTVLPRSATRPPLSSGRGDAHARDADFLLPPWLCALQFLGKDRAWERPGIRAIKDNEKLFRAPLVAGVVTSCKPNGLGDLFLTLKDPTDSISASVHKKVLLEENNGHDISIGCAVIFRNVAIFHPSRKLCCLNVTKGKVMKVFSKDCAAPAKQVISSSTAERSQGGDSTSNTMMKILGHEDMMPSNNDKHTSSCSTDGQNLSTPNNIGCFSTPKENFSTSSGWTDEQLSELFADY